MSGATSASSRRVAHARGSWSPRRYASPSVRRPRRRPTSTSASKEPSSAATRRISSAISGPSRGGIWGQRAETSTSRAREPSTAINARARHRV